MSEPNPPDPTPLLMSISEGVQFLLSSFREIAAVEAKILDSLESLLEHSKSQHLKLAELLEEIVKLMIEIRVKNDANVQSVSALVKNVAETVSALREHTGLPPSTPKQGGGKSN